MARQGGVSPLSPPSAVKAPLDPLAAPLVEAPLGAAVPLLGAVPLVARVPEPPAEPERLAPVPAPEIPIVPDAWTEPAPAPVALPVEEALPVAPWLDPVALLPLAPEVPAFPELDCVMAPVPLIAVLQAVRIRRAKGHPPGALTRRVTFTLLVNAARPLARQEQ